MIEKKDIFKMARHIFRHGQGISDPKIMHPGREWAIGLMGAGLSIVLGAVVSMSTFISYSQDNIEQTDTTETSIPYRAALVEKAISLYQAKQAIYQSLSGKVTSNSLSPTVNTDSSITPTTTESDSGESPVSF